MGATKVDVVAAAETLVVMQVVSGHNKDTQWFTYMPSFFGQPIRIEWDRDTMFAALPSDVANYLIGRGYARLMTDAEIAEYNTEGEPK
jgi:hypothetical protein